MEDVFHEDSFFYFLNLDPKKHELILKNVNVTTTPYCSNSASSMTLILEHRESIENSILTASNPSGILKLDFDCLSDHHDAVLEVFNVGVSVTVEDLARRNTEVITWYFHRLCAITPSADAVGLDVTFKGIDVITRGAAQGTWNPRNPYAFDVGSVEKNKDVKFLMDYTNAGSHVISYQMLDPVFDQAVIKSVVYKGNGFLPGTHSIEAGTSTDLTVRVTCLEHNSHTVGDVRVGFKSILDADGARLNPVEFKFQVECAAHKHAITPFGVLFIVLGCFTLVGCIGGYAYNSGTTVRRGVSAIPFVHSVKALFNRRKVAYYPVVQDDDADVLAEEIFAKRKGRGHEYGAI